MDAVDLVRYNHVMRARYGRFFVAELSWAQLTTNHQTSHQTIAGAFMHGCNMEEWYLHDLPQKREWTGPQFDSFTDTPSMVRRLEQVQRATEELIRATTVAQLTTPLQITVEGVELTTTLETLLIESALEDITHRGEINAMLWHDDIEPPYVPYALWVSAGRPADGGPQP